MREHTPSRGRSSLLLVLLVFAAVIGLSGAARATIFQYNLVDPSQSGDFWISLPAVISSPVVTSCIDLQNVIPNVTGLWRLDRATDVFVQCACPSPNCFGIVPGEGYKVRVVPRPSNFPITGDDFPVMIPLLAAGPGSNSGQVLVSLPFSTTLTRAGDVWNSIGGSAALASVKRFLTATDSLMTYTGNSAVNNFNLTGGESYIIQTKVGAATKYWGPPVGSLACANITGVFAPGLSASQMASAFCASPDWSSTSYSCNQLSDTAKITTTITACTASQITLVFLGSTTGPHPFGYQVCCNSPLSNKMGADGNYLVSLDNTSVSFGEITVSSRTKPTTGVPALSTWGIFALVLGLSLVGVYLLKLRSSAAAG